MLMAANCYFWKNDFDKAIEFYTQAIRVNPDNAYAYAWRGAARGHLGQCEASVADYDEAVRLEPHNPTYYSGRGNAHSYAGQHDLAMKDHEMAFKLADKQ
jgi:tetratricopeptide (TPR) repeat protein